MFKKLPISIALSFFAVSAYAQVIVGTAPENRNVILEEFTGVNCQFCPDGHTIANNLANANPGDFFIINVHSGGFANPGAGQPDFRIPEGQGLDNQSGLAGYPAGTINRENFPGLEQGAAGSTALGRGNWGAATAQVLSEQSYVNVGVVADLDVSTGILTMDVEAFYTADSPVPTNKFNVSILQNNTLGPQVGGNMGNNYPHQHRLIAMPTGQFGVDITNTTAGSLFSQTINYTVPADINGVPVELGELEIVVSVAESNQYIVSGSGTTPTISGLTSANDANLRTVAELDPTCLGSATPSINVQNLGSDPITSLDITYDVNGGTPSNFTWTGMITSLQSEDIELPEITFAEASDYVLTVTLEDDEVNTNNTVNTTFTESPDTTGTVYLTVTTDDWAQEVSWNFTDSAGTILETGGGFSANGSDDRTTFNYTYNFSDDCITFNMFDSFGDGLTAGGNGGVELRDANDVIIYAFNADYGAGFSVQFDSNGILGNNDNSFSDLAIYPNPASNVLNIKNAENASIEIYNMLGQVMTTESNISLNEQINVSQLVTGTYFVKISNGNAVTTKKFIVAK